MEEQNQEQQQEFDQEQEQDSELDQEQESGGESYPDIKRRLISADDARKLMVRSVRGLDSKLSEVSKIIQTTARRGETRAEVHSVQSSRSSLPIFDRIDNLGRVLLGSLRDSGYDAKLREFRTTDSCMLYIVADWSRTMEKKPEDNLVKASEAGANASETNIAKRKPATPERKLRTQQPATRTRPASLSPLEASKAADDPAKPESDHDTDDKATTAAQAQDSANVAEEPTTTADNLEAQNPSTSDDAPTPETEQDTQEQSQDFAPDPDKKEVKTKKFDRSKLISRDTAKKAVKSAKSSNKSRSIIARAAEPYAYSSEVNGERIPIILPVVMPSSRLPL